MVCRCVYQFTPVRTLVVPVCCETGLYFKNSFSVDCQFCVLHARSRRTAGLRRPTAAGPSRHRTCGQEVIVHGRIARPELNGRRGQLLHFVENTGHCAVRVASPAVLIKLANLELADETTGMRVLLDGSHAFSTDCLVVKGLTTMIQLPFSCCLILGQA